MDPAELLTSNLALIERAIAFASRRCGLDRDEAEELASTVHLRLVENDYAVLRSFAGLSSFQAFIGVVVQRMALDFRTREWGKWHDSAEAKRLGELAVALERLLHRDRRTFEDAYAILRASHEGLTRESLQALAGKLPQRAPRRRSVPIEEADPVAAPHSVEEPLLADDRRRASEHLSRVMANLLARVPDEERLVLQLRFEGGMSVAEIARALQLDQKLLYRQLERRMRGLRAELERNGVDPADALDLVGRDDTILRFELRKPPARPSVESDGTHAAHREESE